MRRLVVVLADGLRPDAVSPGIMPSLDALGGAFTLAHHACTVRPSTTVPALASLATGVGPPTHRLLEPGLGFLSGLGALRPLAWELARHGITTEVVTAGLGRAALPVAWTLVSAGGGQLLVAAGTGARQAAAAAQDLLDRRKERLYIVYLPDCDRAGHAHGWMSEPYLQAAAEVDAAIGRLTTSAEDAVFIITADHGGGGVSATDHYEPHPANDRIPLVLAGPGVARRHQVRRPVSLLDVPATILWWFGIAVPECYEGRPLAEAFARIPGPAATAAV